MTFFRSLLVLMALVLSVYFQAASRRTVELNDEIDLLTKNASGDY